MAEQSPPLSTPAGGMGRHMGLFSVTFLIIGRMIGGSIFSTPSSITESMGSIGAALLLWVGGFLVSLAGMSVWLELGCMFPHSGGDKVYLEAAYKRPKLLATSVFAVDVVFLGLSASGCITFATYFLDAIGHQNIKDYVKRAVAIAAILVITMIHVAVPKTGIRIMNGLGIIKISLLVFVVLVGFVSLGRHGARRLEHSFVGTTRNANLYAAGSYKVIHTFAGWANAATVLDKVRDPVRTIKIAAPLALFTVGTLFVLANVGYYAVLGCERIIGSGLTVASDFMAEALGHASAGRVTSVLVAMSAFGQVMVGTFCLARVNRELAKEGVLPWPKLFASTWPTGSPTGGFLLHITPSIIVIAILPFGHAYEFILNAEGYPGTIINLFVVAGWAILRYRNPEYDRPFRTWYPVAVGFALVQLFMAIAPFLPPPTGRIGAVLPYWLYPIVGISVLVLAVAYWVCWVKIWPRVGHYKLRAVTTKLEDGTVVAVWTKVKQA